MQEITKQLQQWNKKVESAVLSLIFRELETILSEASQGGIITASARDYNNGLGDNNSRRCSGRLDLS